MRLRPAVDEDVETLAVLVDSAYRGETSRGGWTTEADLLDGARTSPAQLREMLRDGPSVQVVEDDDGALLGCFELRASGEATAYFGMFVVRPGRQGAGLGRAVLAEAERMAAADLGASVVEMTVLAQRVELIAWYERRGFARTGRTRPFPYDDQRFGVPRRDDLHFVVLRKELD